MKRILLVFLIVLIGTAAAAADEEKLFNQAKNLLKREEIEKKLLMLTQTYPETYYGQLAYLEMAKLNILDRNYESAIFFLKQIFIPEIKDKQFWMAKAYLKNNQYKLAAIAAQMFISESDDETKVEIAYFIIAESYLLRYQYKKALDTLEELRKSKYIKNNVPLLYYKIGICNELLSHYDSALLSYRKLKKEFPYHQFSYLAEERIYQLSQEKRVQLDPSVFGTYRRTEPEKSNPAATSGNFDLYLQLGAFSSRDNADMMGKRVKKIGYESKIQKKKSNGKDLFVVLAGPFGDETKLAKAKGNLKKHGIDSFLVKEYNE